MGAADGVAQDLTTVEAVGQGSGVVIRDRQAVASDAREGLLLSAEHLAAVSDQAAQTVMAVRQVRDQAVATRDASSVHRGAMGARVTAVVAQEAGLMTAPDLHKAVVSKRLKFPSSLSPISF